MNKPAATIDVRKEFAIAIFAGDAQKVQSLIDQGVDVNEPLIDLAMTPISCCWWNAQTSSFDKSEKVARVLMAAGADPHYLNRDLTNAITKLAANETASGVLNVILSCGPHNGDPNRMDGNGRLPLELFASQNNLKVLVKHGADPFKPNEEGITPMQAHSSRRTKQAMVKEAVFRLVAGADGRIDVGKLVDESGKPTEILEKMLDHGLAAELAKPANFSRGDIDIGEIYQHLPEAVQRDVDLTPYRRERVRSSDESGIERFRRTSGKDDARGKS